MVLYSARNLPGGIVLVGAGWQQVTHVALNTSKLVPEGGWERQDCTIIRPASASWDPALNPRLHFKYRACKNYSEVNKKKISFQNVYLPQINRLKPTQVRLKTMLQI